MLDHLFLSEAPDCLVFRGLKVKLQLQILELQFRGNLDLLSNRVLIV